MKKLLLGSIVLLIFSVSIIFIQISCSKPVTAQSTSYTLPPATTSVLGGVIVGSGLSVSSNGTLSVNGSSGSNTNQNKIIVAQDTVLYIYDYTGKALTGNIGSKLVPFLYSNSSKPSYIYSVKFSPDCTLLFIQSKAYNTNSGTPDGFYSMDANGNNVKQIVIPQSIITNNTTFDIK